MSKDEFEAQIRAAYKQTEARRAAGFASTFIIFEAGYKAGYFAAAEEALNQRVQDIQDLKEIERRMDIFLSQDAQTNRR